MIDLVATLITVGVVLVGMAGAAVFVAQQFLYICQPNEVLIFSGSHRASPGQRGYRTVKGGRAWRVPLFEKVDRLDLTNMSIDVSVNGAYSMGGIPLNVQGVANVKIAGYDPVLGNAVERLLGKPRDEIVRTATNILEGNLRGVLSRLTPEEVNNDKLAFAEKLLDEAEPDLARLGMVLDTMKIQNVHDDRGYLDSIGRQQSAEIQKRSRIAEANAKAAAVIKEANNRQRARLREIINNTEIARAEAARRIADAKTRAGALIAQAKGEVDAEIARAEAAMEAEEARVEQVRRQLDADVIAPAKARMEEGINDARGKASRILEDGRATVDVLREMVAVWKEAGPQARDIFLMQKFQSVLAAMVDTIGTVKVDRLTMLPSQGDDTASKAVRLVEELKGGLGVDLPELLQGALQPRQGSGTPS